MRFSSKEVRTLSGRSRGFSTIELLVVIAVSAILAALAIPGYNTIRRTLRITGDGRDLNGAINQAKLEAASSFTRARLYVDLAANTFHIETWNKTAACWQTVNDPNNLCTAGTSPVQKLSPGVTFGFANVGNPPPNTQALLAQGTSGTGTTCLVRNGLALGQFPNTACVQFNSRGIPIDPKTGAPIGSDAFYITDKNTVYAVTIGATGVTQVWTIDASGSGGWQHR